MTALVPAANARRNCENCRAPLIPFGSEACWSCGGPSKRIEQGRDGSERSLEIITLGLAIGGGIAYTLVSTDVAAVVGGVIGAAIFGLGAGIRVLAHRRRASAQLAARDPVRALGASPTDDIHRTRLDAIERDAVTLLVQIAAGLRANADAVAARGGSSPALDRALQTLVDVRTRYEAHLGDTLVASELVAVAGWLRRMSALASLPCVDADQARAVMARFDHELAAARSSDYIKRARLAPAADPTLALIMRETYPALAVRGELASTLPPRFADPWTRAIDAAAPLRATLADQLELAAVRAAANVAGQVYLIDNPATPTLALTATASVVGSLEAEVARLIDESERIRAEGDALREVEQTLAR